MDAAETIRDAKRGSVLGRYVPFGATFLGENLNVEDFQSRVNVAGSNHGDGFWSEDEVN